MGTPYVLVDLAEHFGGYAPKLFIAGERTGEKGTELFGEVCIENRGVMRFEVIARGARAHSALAAASADLGERLLLARQALTELFQKALTLKADGGWAVAVPLPVHHRGAAGAYNITADHGVLGVEVRSIPQDRLSNLAEQVQSYCTSAGLEFKAQVQEEGNHLRPGEPVPKHLIGAVETAAGEPARVAQAAGHERAVCPRRPGRGVGHDGHRPARQG